LALLSQGYIRFGAKADIASIGDLVRDEFLYSVKLPKNVVVEQP
jgi:hypothetical protein